MTTLVRGVYRNQAILLNGLLPIPNNTPVLIALNDYPIKIEGEMSNYKYIVTVTPDLSSTSNLDLNEPFLGSK